MQLSIAIPPGPQALELAVRAESLGYDRVWLYDSAAIYEDIWIHLARIAEATDKIGIGTAVLVPNLRHVMAAASAIATVERLAPGRLACAMGTGYTGRKILGKNALPWQFMREYILQLKGLLRGEVVTIDGEACQMIHRPELAITRPIEVPILLSAFGPKGLAITREIADGWMGVAPPTERFEWAVQMVNGAVVAEGESPSSKRIVDAVGPWQVGAYHFLWENDPDSVTAIPGGAEWLAQIQSERPTAEQHLAVHSGHVTHLNAADQIGLKAFGDEIPWHGWVGDAADLLGRAEASAAAGTTEILYTPAGDDCLALAEDFYEALRSIQDEKIAPRGEDPTRC